MSRLQLVAIMAACVFCGAVAGVQYGQCQTQEERHVVRERYEAIANSWMRVAKQWHRNWMDAEDALWEERRGRWQGQNSRAQLKLDWMLERAKATGVREPAEAPKPEGGE